MKRHAVTLAEMRAIAVEQMIAAWPGVNKQILFRYDIGRKRLIYVVREYASSVSDCADDVSEYFYDTIEDAVTAYNDLC